MKKPLLIAIATLLLCSLLLSSCATIFTKSSYPVVFNTDPQGAQLTIKNRAGITVYSGTTPANIRLKAAAGYMSREEYQIEIKKEGYTAKLFTISASLDGWYIGNIVLGGLIGMLIVDPASGAMFKISEKQVNETLSPLSTSELQVYDINHLPEGVDKSNLVAIQ